MRKIFILSLILMSCCKICRAQDGIYKSVVVQIFDKIPEFPVFFDREDKIYLIETNEKLKPFFTEIKDGYKLEFINPTTLLKYKKEKRNMHVISIKPWLISGCDASFVVTFYKFTKKRKIDCGSSFYYYFYDCDSKNWLKRNNKAEFIY